MEQCHRAGRRHGEDNAEVEGAAARCRPVDGAVRPLDDGCDGAEAVVRPTSKGVQQDDARRCHRVVGDSGHTQRETETKLRTHITYLTSRCRRRKTASASAKPPVPSVRRYMDLGNDPADATVLKGKPQPGTPAPGWVANLIRPIFPAGRRGPALHRTPSVGRPGGSEFLGARPWPRPSRKAQWARTRAASR